MTENPQTPDERDETTSTPPANTDAPDKTPKMDDDAVVVNYDALTSSEDKTDAPMSTPAAMPDDVIMVPRVVLNYVLIAVVFFIVGTLMGSFAFPSGGGGAELPADLEATVRRAVVDVFEDAGISTTRGPEDGDRIEVVMDDDDPYMGNPDGPITIIEFSDFMCGFCGRFATETLPTLMDEYGDQVRFIYMDFPVISPQASPVIASAAECAHDQDMFWEYHDVLFANSGNISDAEMLYSFAEEIGLDVEAFRTCFDAGTHIDEIRADEAYARELGIRGTPAFFINGRFVNGAVPIDTFRQIIDEELANLG